MKMIVKFIAVLSILATTIYAKNSGLVGSVALVGMAMDYKEYDTSGTLVDSEKSEITDIGGVEGSLGYVFDATRISYNEVGINLMIIGGETTYKGSLLASSNPYGSVVSKTQNTIVDTDIYYKRANHISERFELDYGIGFGYRSWERALSASQIETYKWYSFRPMIGGKFFLSDEVSIGLFMEYQFGINPTMSENTHDFNFDLGGADIFELSLPIAYKFSKKIDIFFEYTYQKQTIKKSNEIVSGSYYYYEPDSTAHNQYIKLGLAFKF